MLIKVTAYSQWRADPLIFNLIETPDSDLFEVRNIEGLDAVKADINTEPLGSIDGEAFSGSSVGKRNLVFTIGLRPDWNDWTPSKLRKKLDQYFMPKTSVRLVFETDDYPPVEISGYVESNEQNIFSKDPENQLSVICPKPDFVAVDPTVLTGLTTDEELIYEYNGTIKTGLKIYVTKVSGEDPTHLEFDIVNPEQTIFSITVPPEDDIPVILSDTVFADKLDFELSSMPGNKYARNLGIHEAGDPDIINRLNYVLESGWPLLQPGTNSITILSDSSPGTHEWTMTFYERYGGL